MKLLITACSKEGFEECPAGAWAPALNREKCLISKGQRGISMAATFYEAITPLHITAHGLKLLWSCSACTHLASPPPWHIWLCKKLLFQFYNPFNSLNSWRDLFRSTVIKYDKRRPRSCLLLPAGFTSTSILLFSPLHHNSRGPRGFECLTEGLGKSKCSVWGTEWHTWGSLQRSQTAQLLGQIRDTLRSLFHRKPGIELNKKAKLHLRFCRWEEETTETQSPLMYLCIFLIKELESDADNPKTLLSHCSQARDAAGFRMTLV